MSQTTTQKLGLTKDDGNEAFLDLRPHVNANMETIDDFAGDISDSIADFETNPATSNHSAGTYFMLENTLHRAKTAIASGESITSSNAEPITIAQVLNTLNGNVSALQDSVSTLNSVRVQEGVASKISISSGGYVNIGKIVVVTLVLNVTEAINSNSTPLVGGFPTSLNANNAPLNATNLSQSSIGMRIFTTNLYGALPATGTWNISGAYLCI